MSEEFRMTEYHAGGDGSGGDDDRISEWELGLPHSDDLTPLSHRLIPPELASAFSISPEPHQTLTDVLCTPRNTLSILRGNSDLFKSFETTDESYPRKTRRVDDESETTADMSKNQKRARLVWTPQLHKRFVDVVAHLGIKNAVPKTIMQLMNVEGLTRENVASHLQKYRLYLKRMQGLSNEGPSSSDHLFASTPIPQESGSGHVAMPMMMHVPLTPGHGSSTWMQSYKYGSIGSYHHHHPVSSDDN